MMSFKDEFEDGSIILVMMLILIAGSSYVLITQLNESTRRLTRSQETVDVLNQAKRALISFAVTYPERTGFAASMGPGHFPCPGSVVLAAGESLDTYDGDAPGNCSYNGAVPTLGLLPWEELSLGRLRDANGDYLWYAVSNNFRTPLAAGLTALNSDTPSLMTVNGTPDIVAVIFAPGDLQAGQNNRPSGNDPTQYLEGIAANVTNDDYAFNQIGNDEIITITKQELMTAVEKRILGDISQAFTNYQAAYGAFPWLTPFNNPDTTDFRGIVQVAGLPSEYQGHIPHHWLADPDSAVNGGAAVGRNPFTTNLQISWDILNAQIDDLDGTN
jgi:hypothetical protein